MTTEFQTEGEKMLQRPLEQEDRAGVPHYKTGQHKAVIVGDDTHLTAVLSFVNALGVAVQFMCKRGEGGWEPCPESTAQQASMAVFWGTKPLPKDVALSGRMTEALKAAEREYLERFVSDG